MTNEEAIKIISQMIKDEEGFLSDDTIEAHKMAIKALETIPKYKDTYYKGWCDGAYAVFEHLKMCEEEQSGDLISRQAVLDIIHRFFTEEVDKIPTKKTEDGEVYVIHKCQPLFEMNKAICKRIKALSSVSPTQNCVENALDMRCDDLISRQAVIDALTKTSGIRGDALKALYDLPPANPQEPKTGHWIEYTRVLIPEPFNSWEQAWYCSECGYGNQECVDGSAWLEWKYCPNCGARMAERSDKE